MDKLQPYIVGGMSAVTATCVVQPMDMIKTSIQIQNESLNKDDKGIKNVVNRIYTERGIKGFYIGIDSAIVR